MNCNGCQYLTKENQCKLGKHSYLLPLWKDAKIEKLTHKCIFKNAHIEMPGYQNAHNIAKSNIAVHLFHIVDGKFALEDTIKRVTLAEKDTVIGKQEVVCRYQAEKEDIQTLAYTMKRINGNRMWSISWQDSQETFLGIPKYCIDSPLPYIYVSYFEPNIPMIRNFEHYCFSQPIPNKYVDGMDCIYRTQYIREEFENAVNSQANLLPFDNL